MLKTARAFFSDTAEKHASPARARTADHPIRNRRKFKADMLELAKTFLKPVRSPKVFAAVVDFAVLPDLTLNILQILILLHVSWSL